MNYPFSILDYPFSIFNNSFLSDLDAERERGHSFPEILREIFPIRIYIGIRQVYE